MKNTRDPFDEALRNRLDNYSEEPNDRLWSGIASNIDTVKPPFAWTKWLSISSAVVIVTGVVLYFSWNGFEDNRIADGAKASLAEALLKGENDMEKATDDNTEAQVNAEMQRADVPEIVSQSSDEESESMQQIKIGTGAGENGKTIQTNVDASPPGVAINNVKDANEDHGTTSATSAEEESRPKENIALLSVTNAVASPAVAQVDQYVISDPIKIGMQSEGASSEQQMVTPLAANTTQDDLQHTEANIPVSDSLHNTVEQTETKEVVAKLSGKKEKQHSNSRLSLYLTAMPTFGYHRIEANQNDNVFIESVARISHFSTKRLGVRAEIGAEYALTKKLRAFGGILYYQRKQTIDYTERVPINSVVDNLIDSVIVIQPEFTSKPRTFEYELRNLGIQFGVNYVLKEKKFLHTVGTGVEFHKALNKLPESQRNLGFHSNPSTYVFANLYYRLQYPADGKLRAVFQPTFNYSLYLNQDMNAPFFVKPYGLGLNLGLTYRFN